MSLDWVGDAASARGVTERRFDLARAGRTIPGLLWTPAGAHPRALVLLGHGAASHKRQGYIVSLARRIVRHHAFAAAAIDGPVHGDRRDATRGEGDAVQTAFGAVWNGDPTMIDEMVADWRATLDALQSPDVLGITPVGWWGLSMGTILGLPVVAAEPRIRVAVLGLMGIAGPTAERFRRDAAAVRCPVLFLMQWDDELFQREQAFELFAAFGTADKRLHANPGHHTEVPGEEFDASETFLTRTLTASDSPITG